MTKKISDLNEHKRKKGKLTLEGSARLAAKRFLNSKYDSSKEPNGLASGKTSKSGEFVKDDKGDNDEK
ncbi:hypothetical protein CN03_03525 [Thalassolituus oleivorans]|uniref:hypothetical protein n=1 Tax=Thalassolituus oleivorans TaxID=187493 RepID=UPI0009494DE5|nr:hypothetical protein [Thalassolituus oleivorans]APR66077.1 hypothetical protein CN03_03525 [Thalassolituus oleivorans]